MIRIPSTFAAGLMAGALFAAPALTTPAMAQTPTQDSADGNDRITITGVQPERMREFAKELMEPGKLGQLSRWEDKICPGVVGLTPDAAQVMIDRIAMRALNVSLRVGEPGCKANVLIVVTEDGQKLTPTFVAQNKKLFGDAIDAGNTLGQAALAAFTKNNKPVRWWHVSQTVTDRGQVLGESVATPAGGGGFNGAQVARVNNASRLAASTHQEFNRIIAIVDTSKTNGASFSAVADYIAMIALTQLQADVDAGGFDSILNVFDGPVGGAAPLTAWTAWDAAFVNGLYAVQKDFVTSKQMENEIVRQVTAANAEQERQKAEEQRKS